MLTLGIDTALNHCSVAIVRNGAALARASVSLTRGHAEILPPQVSAAMRSAGVEAKDFDRVGVVTGPGSFAGVRVGLAFARSFVLGEQAIAVGVTSLEALAAPAFSEEYTLVGTLIDAWRGEAYAALERRGGAVVSPPFLATVAEALSIMQKAAGNEPVLLVGDGAPERAAAAGRFIIGERSLHIDPVVVATLAAAKPAPTVSPSPLYLRPPDAAPAARSALEGLFDLRR